MQAWVGVRWDHGRGAVSVLSIRTFPENPSQPMAKGP